MSLLGSPLKLAVFPELATGKARKIVFLEFKAAAYGQSTVQRWLEKLVARGGAYTRNSYVSYPLHKVTESARRVVFSRAKLELPAAAVRGGRGLKPCRVPAANP